MNEKAASARSRGSPPAAPAARGERVEAGGIRAERPRQRLLGAGRERGRVEEPAGQLTVRRPAARGRRAGGAEQVVEQQHGDGDVHGARRRRAGRAGAVDRAHLAARVRHEVRRAEERHHDAAGPPDAAGARRAGRRVGGGPLRARLDQRVGEPPLHRVAASSVALVVHRSAPPVVARPPRAPCRRSRRARRTRRSGPRRPHVGAACRPTLVWKRRRGHAARGVRGSTSTETVKRR